MSVGECRDYGNGFATDNNVLAWFWVIHCYLQVSNGCIYHVCGTVRMRLEVGSMGAHRKGKQLVSVFDGGTLFIVSLTTDLLVHQFLYLVHLEAAMLVAR